ncbi:L,D-transpeptidase [Azospirillum brasilense]|uniref:L,D-transpeptidase n=1 Tax=Azospirillum brasilense TaxID=192 RepID=UPI000E68CA6E|nr:L,D-transpeptidase [Azospirillum brasilense]NUB26607.1 L,D-transpeptidase family protein [Azospirillum brasilense]NUB34316.1 L,D-transpeptidase family protein [Azospirillum brasilense]RIW08176.1 L,D-transpeptidase [Azospirillum brasilense]
MQRTATFLWHLVPTATLAIALALVSPGGVRAQDTATTTETTSTRQIVISLSERRLHLLEEGRQPRSFPVAIGRPGVAIPLGDSQVLRKRRNPTWRPTANQRRENPALPASVPPGPSNPLGRFALDLGWTAIAIHGTNEPSSVGRRASGGCFRMLPVDIATLFEAVPVGTPVRVVSGPATVPPSEPAVAVAVTGAVSAPPPKVAPPLPIVPDPRCATAGAPLRRMICTVPDLAALDGRARGLHQRHLAALPAERRDAAAYALLQEERRFDDRITARCWVRRGMEENPAVATAAVACLSDALTVRLEEAKRR